MLCLHNGGLHETLNLLHVGSCKMSHFLTCYMNQTKNHKQSLKSVQYRPEIILTENPLQTHGNMKPQTFHFFLQKKNYTRGLGHTFLFLKIDKFGVPYFYEFVTHINVLILSFCIVFQ